MSKVALVLVDIQRDFWEPISTLEEFRDFPDNIRRLREYAKKAGIPVIHVRSLFREDRSDWMLFYKPEGRGTIPCIIGTPGAEFTEFTIPEKGERVITKVVFDAFKENKLKEALSELGVSTIILAGIETSVCVLFTATSAYLNRILPVVITDACADSPERHQRTIEMYSNLCFKTATTNSITTDPMCLKELVETFSEG